MILLEVHFSSGAASAAFVISIIAMCFAYGRQTWNAMKAKNDQQPYDKSTSNKISEHYTNQGYDVRSILPDGIDKWVVAIIKNDKERIVKVVEVGNEIQEKVLFNS